MYTKKIMLVLFLLFSVTVFPQKKEKDIIAIKKALHQSAVEWSKGNIDKYMKVYWKSEKLQFVGRGGITYGWQKTLDNYKKNYPTAKHTGKLTFTVLEVTRLSKKVYSLIGTYHLKREIGNASGIFSLLFKKIKGKWVIVLDHTS